VKPSTTAHLDTWRERIRAFRHVQSLLIAVGGVELVPDGGVRRPARKSLAHHFIKRLPNGYEQQLGRRFEGGVDLSGSEWQKSRSLALTIATLNWSPSTSLPPVSTHALSTKYFRRFAKLTQGKIALLTSHLFSTVRMADRIVVLENGRIAEQNFKPPDIDERRNHFDS